MTRRRMTLKLFIFLTTCVLLVYGYDVERKDNAESYITKEAARELRNKLGVRGEQQESDYDELLKRIIMSVQQPNDDNAKQNVYEKKYFDYLPNDLDSEDVTDEDSAHELVKSSGDVMSTEKMYGKSEDNGRRVNSRKFKRDLKAQNHETHRAKRQNFYYAPVPLYQLSPYINADFFFPQESQNRRVFAAPPIDSRFGSQSNNPNPWNPQYNPNARFHTPNNRYLPAYPPSVKPGNNPSPPHNIPKLETSDRGMFEEDDSYQRIWPNNIDKINHYGDKGGGSISNRPTPRPVTQANRPPYVENNSLDQTPNLNEIFDFELEHPPEEYDGPLTTRAPLKKATTKKSQNPNRNPTTQRYEVTTTTTTLSPRTTRKPDRSTNSRQQNQTVPACVLAIVNCCSKYDDVVRTPCFEKHQCNGAFFGRSPCSPDIKSAAFREVEKFSQ